MQSDNQHAMKRTIAPPGRRAPGDSSFTLPAEFWADFAERHWERAPLVLKQPFTRPIASSEDIFGAVITASRAFLDVQGKRPSGSVPRIHFFVDGAGLITDLDEHLPDTRDHSAEDYVGRLQSQLGGRRFELLLYELQEHSVPIWRRLRDFLGGFYGHVGLPAARANAVAFLRTQEHSSFGLHRDDASVFLFVVAGRKRILAWPEDTMVGRERFLKTTRFEAFRDEAVVLEGEPGDVIYWPSSYWHIGESDGGPSISLNLGMRLWPPSLDGLGQLTHLAQTRVAHAIGDTWPLHPEGLTASAGTIPRVMRDALDAAREIAAGENLERYLEFTWLKRVTGAGFMRVPAPAPRCSLSDTDVVQVVADEPIVQVPFGDDRIACSVAGHALVAPRSPHVLRLLERLGAGGRHVVGPLLRACTGEAHKSEEHEQGTAEQIAFLRSVMEDLVRFRALIRVS